MWESCEKRVEPKCIEECKGQRGRDYEECVENCVMYVCGEYEEDFDFIEEDLEPDVDVYE